MLLAGRRLVGGHGQRQIRLADVRQARAKQAKGFQAAGRMPGIIAVQAGASNPTNGIGQGPNHLDSGIGQAVANAQQGSGRLGRHPDIQMQGVVGQQGEQVLRWRGARKDSRDGPEDGT